jgi:transcriptional regulator with PAS, ATPase and Fis domain
MNKNQNKDSLNQLKASKQKLTQKHLGIISCYSPEFVTSLVPLKTRLTYLLQLQQQGIWPRVLICGPSQSGKSTLAFHIWKKSRVEKRPFQELNFEQLFDDKNIFRAVKKAQRGDLFVKGLDLFTEVERKNLFSCLTHFKDVRLLASSLRPIAGLEAVFQETLTIPPLAQRKEDLSLLVLGFLRNLTQENLSLSREAMLYLQGLSWPGEIPQLYACLGSAAHKALRHKMLVISERHVREAWLSVHESWEMQEAWQKILRSGIYTQCKKKGLKQTLQEIEAAFITLGMLEHHNNVRVLAKNLKVPANTLYSKCEVLNPLITTLMNCT